MLIRPVNLKRLKIRRRRPSRAVWRPENNTGVWIENAVFFFTPDTAPKGNNLTLGDILSGKGGNGRGGVGRGREKILQDVRGIFRSVAPLPREINRLYGEKELNVIRNQNAARLLWRQWRRLVQRSRERRESIRGRPGLGAAVVWMNHVSIMT